MKKVLILSLLIISLAGCRREKPVKLVDPQPKTFLMYDNIGGTAFENNVKAAGKAVAAGVLIEGQHVVVYQRLNAGDRIYELVKDGKAGYARKMVKQYSRGEMETLNPVDMRIVIADMRGATPDVAHFGMAFGSHGVGWLPVGSSVRTRRAAGALPTRYLASDTGVKMDVDVFTDVMDDFSWDFFILDDCFMAGLEPMYVMRKMAKYIVASPTEIMMEGFPYDRVVASLFGTKVDWNAAGLETVLAAVSGGFVEYYRMGYTGTRSATVALIKTDEMDALARAVRNMTLNGLNPVNPRTAGVQYYEGLEKHIFYDAEDYFNLASTSTTLYEEFYTQLKKTVVYKDNTDEVYTAYGPTRWFDVRPDGYSGMSVFVPWEETAPLQGEYEQTAWYKAVNE